MFSKRYRRTTLNLVMVWITPHAVKSHTLSTQAFNRPHCFIYICLYWLVECHTTALSYDNIAIRNVGLMQLFECKRGQERARERETERKKEEERENWLHIQANMEHSIVANSVEFNDWWRIQKCRISCLPVLSHKTEIVHTKSHISFRWFCFGWKFHVWKSALRYYDHRLAAKIRIDTSCTTWKREKGI